MAWNINEYSNTVTVAHQKKGVYDDNRCTACSSECYEWASSTKCISCNSGYYLQLQSPGSFLGTCTSYTTSAQTTFDIFVAPELVETSNTGTYQSPFGHIAKALSYADEYAADKGDTVINIYLLGGGIHYMTRNYNHYNYDKTKSNPTSYNQDVTIQPAFWGQTLGGHSFVDGDADCIDSSSKIKVHYKMGNSYRFTVPRSLTVKSVIFDAIDSSIDPTDHWLLENTVWCALDGASLINNDTSSYSGTNCVTYIPQTEQWVSTYGYSFFQFEFTNSSNITEVGTLTVTSCEFQNFFYDFTSFVGLNNGHGHISITGSTFTRFSNCGSIIRDTRNYVSNLNYGNISNSWRSSIYSSYVTKNKYILEASNEWISTLCTSIIISDSKFEDTNYLKSPTDSQTYVPFDSEMKYRGIILNLRNYYGNIAISGNTFNRILFKFQSWENIYNRQQQNDVDYIWQNNNGSTILQAKTLIYINVKSGDTEINGNTFSNCNSQAGLIYLERSSQNNHSPIFIHQNTFTNNSVLFAGSNVLKLHLFTNAGYEEEFNRTDMIWASIQISSNTFSNNVGCHNTVGAIQAACFYDNYDYYISDMHSYWTDPSPMSQIARNNLQTAGVVSFSTVNNHSLSSSSEIIDKNKFMMKSNTFINNFAGMAQSIVYLVNIRRVFIEGDVYQHNSGTYKEALDTYGTITTSGEFGTNYFQTPGAWKLSAYYSDAEDNTTIGSNYDNAFRERFYPLSILRIKGSLYISITNATFDNNYFAEFDTNSVTNDYRSLAILFEKCNGEAHMHSLTLQNYYGWNLDNLQTILGSKEYSNVITASPTERSQNDGSPNREATTPSYNIDYGFKNALIRLSHPSSDVYYDFKNVFSKMTITSLNVNNVTHYNPKEGIAAIIEVSDDVINFELINAKVDNVDIILDSKSMFYLQPYGTLTVTGGTFSNINSNAYNLSTNEMLYVSNLGAVFTINSVLKSNDYDAFTYTLSSMKFDTINGKKGGALYMNKETLAIIQHEVSVTISNSTFENSRSLTNGLIYSSENRHNITIKNCIFQDNHGVNGEADIHYVSSSSVRIIDTSLTRFTSDGSSTVGQSITLQMAIPFTNTVEIQNMTVQCNDDALTSDEYMTKIQDPNLYLTKNAPVLLNPGNLKTIRSTFSNWYNSEKGGALHGLARSVYIDEGSTFTLNAAKEGGSVYITGTTINLTNTVITINYAETGGAVKFGDSSTTDDYNNVTCSSNTVTQDGGWLNVAALSTVQLRSSTFTSNNAHETSSAIYAVGTDTITITDCTFSKNVAGVGNTISFLFADSTIENTTMQNNECSVDSCNIFVSFSIVNIVDSTMTTTKYSELDNYNEVSGYFLSVSAGSTITITDSLFSNGFASNGGLVYMSGNSAMTITGSSFIGGYANINGGAIYASSFKTLSITNWNFVGNVAYDSGSVLFLVSGTISFDFSNVTTTPKYNAINIVGGNFTSTKAKYSIGVAFNIEIDNQILGGAIYVSNPESFSVTENTFTDLDYAYQGGAIYMTMSSTARSSGIPNSPVCIIQSSSFISNTAKFGGAVYVSGVNYVQISNTSFTSNTAEKDDVGGNGGALYYSSSDNSSQVVFESEVTFSTNNAQDSGGAVYWDYNPPINLTAPSYTRNTATLYGNNYGCFAQLLKSITSSEYNSQISTGRRLNNATLIGSTSLTLENQQSGSQLQNIYLALTDEFDQIVGSDSASIVRIGLLGNHENDTYTPLLTGTNTMTVSKGVVKFDTIQFTAEPSQFYQLEFSTTGIDSSKPSNANYLSSNSLSNTSMPFEITLRACIVGELFETSGACTKWQSPNYYSLETMTEPGNCKDWQTTRMYWYGGSDIGPRPKYWRSSNNTDNFIKWLHTPACLGYNQSDASTNLGEWFTGYQGILWADCEVGFSRTREHECNKCPDPVLNITRLCLVMIAVVVSIVIMVRSTLAGALQRKNIQSVYIKLLMNHLQLLILTASFDFDWPDRVNKMFETSEPVAQVTTQILSFDWFLDQRSEGENSGDGNLVRIYYQKMIMFALLPLLLALGSLLFWNLYFCRKSKTSKEKKISRMMATLIILFFFVHPSIVEYMFSNFK